MSTLNIQLSRCVALLLQFSAVKKSEIANLKSTKDYLLSLHFPCGQFFNRKEYAKFFAKARKGFQTQLTMFI
jgi:hypothetical protein